MGPSRPRPPRGIHPGSPLRLRRPAGGSARGEPESAIIIVIIMDAMPVIRLVPGPGAIEDSLADRTLMIRSSRHAGGGGLVTSRADSSQ